MDGNVLPSKLITRLSHAVDIVRKHDCIQIYTHYDADGLSSAGILANTFLRAGKKFVITTLTTLEENTIENVKKCEAECIVFADLGASYVKELEKLEKDIVVLDHHTTKDDSDKIAYINPHLFGIDGMVGGCGSSISFLFSVTYDENNWDLVQIAFGGIVGDKQHLGNLKDINSYLLSEGEKRGFIKTIPGSLVPVGPLVKSLCSTTEPYIRGISGNEGAALKLLKDCNISVDADYLSLNENEMRKLSSAIAVKLTQQGVSADTMSELTRTRYFLKDWKFDAETLADLLDACGRTKLQGIGIGVCMGSKNDLLRAYEIKNEYIKNIINATVELDSKGLTQMNHIQYLDSTETGFTGVLCGIAMRYFADPSKPVIGINASEDIVKLSARSTNAQLAKGVDLAVAMGLATKAVGGEGGGHRIASGGSVPLGMEKEFLKNLDDVIGSQLNSAK